MQTAFTISWLQQGIIVRNRSKVELCEGCLRITVGTPDENTVLLDTLKNFNKTVENQNH
jgi:histidinol-phosphate/aromatic aminotransferase/cobyric acid decarboxylase-like protein